MEQEGCGTGGGEVNPHELTHAVDSLLHVFHFCTLPNLGLNETSDGKELNRAVEWILKVEK